MWTQRTGGERNLWEAAWGLDLASFIVVPQASRGDRRRRPGGHGGEMCIRFALRYEGAGWLGCPHRWKGGCVRPGATGRPCGRHVPGAGAAAADSSARKGGASSGLARLAVTPVA